MAKSVIDPNYIVVRKDFDTEHYYWIDEQYVPSVTSILDESAPVAYGLKRFFLQNTPESAREILDTTANFGSMMHDAYQQLLLGNELNLKDDYPDRKAKKHITSFVQWFAEFSPDPESIKTEHTVGSRIHKYAGTLDLYCEKDGKRYIIDFKTSSGIYFSHELQITAYKIAYEEMYGVPIDVVAILRTGTRHKAGYEYKEIGRDPDEFLNVYNTYLSLHDGKIPDPPTIDVYPEKVKLYEESDTH